MDPEDNVTPESPGIDLAPELDLNAIVRPPLGRDDEPDIPRVVRAPEAPAKPKYTNEEIESLESHALMYREIQKNPGLYQVMVDYIATGGKVPSTGSIPESEPKAPNYQHQIEQLMENQKLLAFVHSQPELRDNELMLEWRDFQLKYPSIPYADSLGMVKSTREARLLRERDKSPKRQQSEGGQNGGHQTPNPATGKYREQMMKAPTAGAAMKIAFREALEERGLA